MQAGQQCAAILPSLMIRKKVNARVTYGWRAGCGSCCRRFGELGWDA
jgi:hypothetical protein